MKYVPALALLILVVSSIALAIMPTYLVSPLRSQTVSDLALSHTLTRFATPLALVNVVVGVILALTIWRRPGARLRGKVGAAIALMVLALAANATRGYLAETTFSKLPEIVRVATYDAMHVQPEDLVLGVKFGGETAAYPLPIIGYHHIVNDRLAGEPFVVTY